MHVSANQNILKSIATNNYSGDDDKDDGNDRDDHGEDDRNQTMPPTTLPSTTPPPLSPAVILLFGSTVAFVKPPTEKFFATRPKVLWPS